MLPVEIFARVQQKRDSVFDRPPTVFEAQEEGEVHHREHVKWELFVVCVIHSDVDAHDVVVDLLAVEAVTKEHEEVSAGQDHFVLFVLERQVRERHVFAQLQSSDSVHLCVL